MTRLSLLCVALLTCTLCACATSTPLPEPPPIASCGTEALEYCEGPNPGRSDLLGESELEDEQNRQAWLACIQRHHAAATCLRRLKAAGVLRDDPAP